MTPLLSVVTLMALMQGAEVTASVDRTHLTVGEEVTLTVRARTRTAEPVEIMLPPLTGFAIVGSRDMTEVAITGTNGSVRTTVRELQLRAEQPGALLIGPVRARQGRSVESTDPILVTVDSAADRFTVLLSPLARSLLESAPAPVSHRVDRVALTVLVPSDTVYAGQQVDLIAAAWIPRELRQRMRRVPLLTLNAPEGVWAYPAAASSGVALSRQVSGHWMDLFITHQVVFPLAAGRLIVPPASVEYALPVTFSFFSREESYTLRSDSIAIAVLPLPRAPAPPGTDIVGRGLTLDLHVDPATTRVGEPVEAAVTINGVGNVALWPEPGLKWPAGFRVYPAQTEVRIAAQGGRVAGSKTFRFLAVPDSSGNFVLPEVRYPYFDASAGKYETATTLPRGLAVAAGAEPRAARALPPLLSRRGERDIDRLSRQAGWQGWLAVVLVPPFVAWLARRRWRRSGAAEPARRDGPQLTRLGRLEQEFLAMLTSHVPDAFARDGDGLGQALRAAGVDSAVADHVKRLRDRLRAARYGPRGLGDAAELAAEIEQVLRVLGADGPAGAGARRPRTLVASMVVLGIGLLGARHAVPVQSPRAEALYEAGALRAAADSFAARASADPRDAAHWYNLGATLYRAGADGKATAAWARAARLAPRDPTIVRARNLLPAPDPITERLLRVGWGTPTEWGIAAAVGWVALWLTVAVGAQRRRVLLLAFGALAAGAAGQGVTEMLRRDQPVAVVVVDGAPVRNAPYGGASAAATIPAGGALLVGRSYGPWREVRRGDGIHGWVLESEIAGL
ncbi:MAG TPA: BatD family protein [Gemmatimonadales bacterium]|nr:BatD family protein [Gemmatimonadales bacterium]